MKRFYLLLVLACSVFYAGAQVPLAREYWNTEHSGANVSKPATKAEIQAAHQASNDNSRSLPAYWINYAAAVDYSLGGDLSNSAACPLWPDSTSYIVSGTGDDFFWYVNGYASLVDPVSQYMADYVDANYTVVPTASDWFTDEHDFIVDSVGFYFYYDRPNTGYTDTLHIYIINPNSSAIDDGGYYFDEDGNGSFDLGTDIAVVLTKYNSAQNKPNGTVTEITKLLGDSDTASYHLNYMSLPVNMTIPKGDNHIMGIAWKYSPGKPYSFGDTLLDFSDPPLVIQNPLNVFWLLGYEEIADDLPISWGEYSKNNDGIATTEVRYNLSPGSWNGFYISTYAYTAPFAWEHAFVDWLVEPKGTDYIAVTPSPCVDLTKDFTDLSNFTTGGDATYYWDFGDSQVSTDQNPSHTWATPGTYNVCLVTTDDGSSYEKCKSVVVDFCNAVEEIEDLSNFSMYPNPASDHMNVDLEFTKAEDITISVLSIDGKEISSNHIGTTTAYNSVIDTKGLASGMYMLRIESNGRTTTKNFVVNK